MFGDNRKLREKLLQHGTRADAEVIEAKERPWVERRPGEVGAAAVFRLKLRVSPADEPAFEAEVTDQWADLGEPRVGMKVPVLYAPGHRSKVILDKHPGRYQLVQPGDLMGGPVGSNLPTDDPDLAALSGLDATFGAGAPAPPDASSSRLDRLQQLADLRDRGVLSDDEFATEKAKILDAG